MIYHCMTLLPVHNLEDRPRGTSDWIVQIVRDAVFASKLKPGDKIVEGKLARELNVGISPVREALLQLEHLGLVVRVLKQRDVCHDAHG